MKWLAIDVIVLAIALSAFTSANGQANQSEGSNPATALVSSPLIGLKTRPPISDSVLFVPSRLDVYVRTKLKPVRVEFWTGPTGTEVAEYFVRITSQDKSIAAGSYKKFAFAVTSCKQFAGVFEPRVYVANRHNPYSIYAGPFECHEQVESRLPQSSSQK